MNKLAVSLFALSIISPMAFAEDVNQRESKQSGVFIGVDYYKGDTEIERDFSPGGTLEEEFDIKGYRLKFGVHDENNIRFQGFIKIESLEDDIVALASDGKILGFGADALFTFPVNPSFSPYALVGMSSDYAELDDDGVDYSEDSINGFALKAGLGALFKLNRHVELQAGWDIQYRSWQEMEIDGAFGDANLEQEDTSNSIHIGLNFFF